MLKIKKGLLIISICTLFSSSFLQAEERVPEVEMTHWWNQPGEIQALGEIEKAVKARGAAFVETRIASWDALRTNILKRISLGYAPAVTQWLSDDYIFSFDQMSAIYKTPALWRYTPIDEVLFDEVYEGLRTEEGLVGLPVGIHTQNSALFSKEIYEELGFDIPQTWAEVLEQAPKIRSAGYVPVALSHEEWQLQILLNSILLGNLGASDYKQFYMAGQSIKPWRTQLVQSFEILLALKRYSDEGAKTRNWSEAVNMVGDNKAAMHFLGDFAKSELTSKGLVAGEDFLCSLAPSSKGHMVYVIDSFLMFNSDDPHIKKGQEILIDTVLDPEVQAKFNSKKGGIPVRHGVDVELLDVCARKIYQQWIGPDPKTVSFTGIGNPLRALYIQMVLKKAWSDENASAEMLVDELIKIDQEGLSKAN
ncbi:carbohydrate ABC transporter substrate-binding protein [Leucothrix sargassi]|nr:carbohydrate ABC transporter substrate-binding protein [Leucothrix sargassi]